jgi:hypothetical protein
MGYAKKIAVWLVVLSSLVWLTAAGAKTDSSDTKGKDQSSKNSGDKSGKTENGGTTGATGSTGATGTTGSQGTQDDGKSKSKGDAGRPEIGVSMGAEPTGQVKVTLPGADSAQTVDGSQVLPMGSVVDVRNGKIALTTALDSQGHTQTATFWGGVFRVGQHRGYTEITLAGARPSCPAAGLAHISRRHKKRSLWAQDNHGRYRTRGQNSVATVRGTKWLTEDRCYGTLTHVAHGAVVVKDRHTHRAVVVKAGHSYLARARHAG